MSRVSEIGDGGVIGKVLFEWKIEDFFSLSDKLGDYYSSPVFSFDNSQWYLNIYPVGQKSNISPEWVSLFLAGKDLVPPKTVFYTFGMKGSNGVEETKEIEYTFEKKDITYGYSKCWLRTELKNRKSTFLPKNALTITCDLRSKNITCSNKGGENKLAKSLLNMLESGDDSDLIIKVQKKEFRAHRCILRARSTVFKSMFSHEMAEKQNNVVDIKDVDPEAFSDFLNHIYSGNFAQISGKNACSLYAAADKYDVGELKEACREFLKRSMNVDGFCDVMTLAMKHADKELTEHAKEFFCDNAEAIAKTVDWQNFLEDNSTVGNELFLKAVSKIRNKLSLNS